MNIIIGGEVDWVAPRGQKTAPYGAETGRLFTVAPPELTIEIAIDTIATAQLTSAQLLFAQASSWLYFQRRAHTNEIDLMSISEMVLAPPLGNAVFS